ncbi:Late embryogenis abundant protein 2 [Linum perenne]
MQFSPLWQILQTLPALIYSPNSSNINTAAVTKAIRNRGFSSSAAAATAVKGGAVSAAGRVKKTGEETPAGKQRVSSWIPDPRTGFYRPDNVAEEIDAAELRALLLKKH